MGYSAKIHRKVMFAVVLHWLAHNEYFNSHMFRRGFTDSSETLKVRTFHRRGKRRRKRLGLVFYIKAYRRNWREWRNTQECCGQIVTEQFSPRTRLGDSQNILHPPDWVFLFLFLPYNLPHLTSSTLYIQKTVKSNKLMIINFVRIT